MFCYELAVFLSLFCVQRASAAVLTNTITAYFPLQHGNTLPASENGVISYIGEANGITTYILNEPQSPELTATFIEGPSVAVVIVSANPTFIASYSCNIQGPQAVCLEANINPQNGQVVSQISTDVVDPIALVEIGSPQPSPSPSPPATTPPPPPPPPPPPTSGGGDNGGGNSPPPSSPSPSKSPAAPIPQPTSQITTHTISIATSASATPNTDTSSSSSHSTSAASNPSVTTPSSRSSSSTQSIPALSTGNLGDTGGTGDRQSQGILPGNTSSGNRRAPDGVSSLPPSLTLILACLCLLGLL